MSENRYVLWGSAGHAKVLAAAIALRNGRVVALFDNLPVQSALRDVPLYIGEEGFLSWAAQTHVLGDVVGLAAIGGHRGRDRLRIQAFFQAHGLRCLSIVHPRAVVCPTARVGAGSQILAGAVIASDVQIGSASIVNHNASVDHECVLGMGVHVGPGATLCGCVQVGDNVMIGAGATVLPRVTIAPNCLVGAGSIVTRDLPENSIVCGNPARLIGTVGDQP